MKDFSRETIGKCQTPFEQNLWAAGNNFTKREWNRFVAPYIIDEFLDLMKEQDPSEFMQYTGLLTWVNVGMFDSAAKYLEFVVYPTLTDTALKFAVSKFAQMLKLADDYPDETKEKEES